MLKLCILIFHNPSSGFGRAFPDEATLTFKLTDYFFYSA